MDIFMKNSLIEVLKIILLASLVYLVWSIVKISLPIVGVDYNVGKNIEYYANYNLNTFKKKKKKIVKKEEKKKVVKKEESIKFKLVAIYADGANSVITINDSRKIIILGIGEKQKNFKLIKVTNNEATFSKNNKQYVIVIGQKTYGKEITNKVITHNKQKNTEEQEELQTSNIKRQQIRKYKNDISAIWEDISIQKVHDGYSISNIKPKSSFAQIGLKKGDIIHKVNNKILKTNKNVIDMYKKLDTISYIKLELIRDGEVRDIEFNIE
jgi:type II secretion system protein C